MTDFQPIVHKVSKASDPEKWLELRRSGIGGSDVAAIFGLNPWSSALEVWLEKKGQKPDPVLTERMEIGEFMEDSIAQLFSKRTGLAVRPSNVVLQHPKHKFMLASIDRWVQEADNKEGVLEIKNVGERMADAWDDGQVPDYYLLQVMHYLCVTGADYAWIAPLIGGNRLKPVRILRDDRLIDEIIEAERKFWHLVETDQPPAIDDSDAAEEVLRVVYPHSTTGKAVTLDADMQEVYRNYLKAREALKLVETEVQGYKNLLMAAMEDAENAYIPGRDKPVITYRGTTSSRFNQRRFMSEHPDVAAKYMTESSSRRFLVKGE